MKSNHLIEIHEFLLNNPTFSNVVSDLRKKIPQKLLSSKSSYGYIISTLSKLFNLPTIVITSNPEESIEILDSINLIFPKNQEQEESPLFLEYLRYPERKNLPLQLVFSVDD